ncbi:MAG: exodeoxyribonuclease VII large subunit, partial [Clostridia bacterium]|nr:exodeoxyribonuclease VII large subunit [Clostridia bacterium]
WCFNDETLARRIAKCEIPVISAVGHETDFTICDFVADMRAPTPSAAAEIAVPDIEEIKASVMGFESLIKMRVRSVLQLGEAKLQKINAAAEFRDPRGFMIKTRENDLEKTTLKIKNSFEKSIVNKEKAFSNLAVKIDSMSPLKTMARGYLSATKDGKTVNSKTDVSVGDRMTLRFIDGKAECEVKEVE